MIGTNDLGGLGTMLCKGTAGDIPTCLGVANFVLGYLLIIFVHHAVVSMLVVVSMLIV